ncbi:MAG: glycosyltransferase [Proteobacteria bacterium]|nr:glycosyltransferase [Pseudomonadota bacterium]
MDYDDLRIAFIIPCFNEAPAIAAVIQACRTAIPSAQVHVFDNRSTDGTSDVARRHGAIVTNVPLRGKGNVVRRMFADVEADVYIMADGDGTYDLSNAMAGVHRLVDDKLDMIVGSRIDKFAQADTYRKGHRFGNWMLTSAGKSLFGGEFTDMLSGFRIFSRRYVKSFPALASGFEIETELAVHALEQRMPCAEMPVHYFERAEGTESKLSTYRDGWRILWTIARFFINERPLVFFSWIAAALALSSLVLAAPLAVTYVETGLVPRLPTAILATGLMLAAMLSGVCGAVLRTVTLGRKEAKRVAYLSIPVLSRIQSHGSGRS